MEGFARMMRRSGFCQKFRHEVITDAIKGHEKRVKEEEDGGRPVDRPREYQERERRKRREEKRQRFYRKEKRGTTVREAVIIIPPTPEGILAEKMKKICREEMKENNIRLTIQERGERNLATLSATVCLEQEAHSTVKERSVLCAILEERREFAGKPELVTESHAMSVEKKSCQSKKVRQVEILTQEEMNMHKMLLEKLKTSPCGSTLWTSTTE